MAHDYTAEEQQRKECWRKVDWRDLNARFWKDTIAMGIDPDFIQWLTENRHKPYQTVAWQSEVSF